MNVRELVQRALRPTGYHFTRWPVQGSIERELQRVLKELDITCVLDIGGHEGRYGMMLRELGYRGRIISFEPAAVMRDRLAASAAKDSLWDVRAEAIGDEDGTADLFEFVEHTELSSLRRPSGYGSAAMTVASTRPVPVRRLDSLVEDLRLRPDSTFVKVDTQGHDVAVLRGGDDLLRRTAALQVEVPTIGLYEGAPTMTEMLSAVEGYGYSLVGMFPVHEPRADLLPIEFDGLFVANSRTGRGAS